MMEIIMITGCGMGYAFGWPWGMFMGIIFWLFLTFGVFYIITHLFKAKSDKIYQKETPLDLLKRKYANGEIDSAEFEKRKATILS